MSNFRQRWDPYAAHGASDPNLSEEQRDSVQVIEALKPRRGKETASWLASVSDHTSTTTPIEAKTDSANPAPQPSEMVQWVEAMFDTFEELATTFNQSAVGTNCTVGVQRPIYHYEEQTFETNYEPVIAVFKGHLATRTWGLLVQGHHDTIEIFVVAADQLLTFTFHDIHKSGYQSFMTIESAKIDGQLEWRIEGGKITHDMLPLLCKELLGDLVRITTGTMSEDELFAHQHSDLKLGENVAQGFASQPAAPAATSTATPQAVSSPDPASKELKPDLRKLKTWSLFPSLWQAIDADFQLLSALELQADNNEDSQSVQAIRLLAADLQTLKVQTQELLKKHAEKAKASV